MKLVVHDTAEASAEAAAARVAGVIGSANDRMTFTFSEAIAPTTITLGNVDTVLADSGAGGYDAQSVTWNSAGTELTVLIGGGSGIAVGNTVNPTNAVTDYAGNVDVTSAAPVAGTAETWGAWRARPS